MSDIVGAGRARGRLAAAGCALLAAVSIARAGTTGKISGRVIDAQNRPVVAATVAVVGQPYGAFTNAEGVYDILQVPPGTYEVRINRVGFKPHLVRELIVSADHTTRLDVALEDTTIVSRTVVVDATRPPVDINLTSSEARLRTEDIEALPVQELQDIVNLQAGVVEGHFRGGRLGEVQFQVDGVSVNNSYDNTSSLRIDRSLLQEVQVISGTFDAEYGQAMSGVVNAVLKNGTSKFEWNLELFGGGFLFPGRTEERLVTDGVQPGAVLNGTLTLSGPTGLPKTVFLANVRRYALDDYIRGRRDYLTTPTFNDSLERYEPTPGDGAEVVLGFTRETSGALKLTNASIQSVKLSYQLLFNRIEARAMNYTYRFLPDALPEQQTDALAHGFDWTQTLGKATFLETSLRQNYRYYEDHVYADVWDSRYDAAGPVHTDPSDPSATQNWGVSFTRFEQLTNAFIVKSALVSQVSHVSQLKGGFELQIPEVKFGTPGHVVGSTPGFLTRHFQEPPDYTTSQTYWPVLGGAYLQDQLEWPDLTLRAGARVDYFDARSTIPSDLANPANAIQGAPESVPQATTIKIKVSPRLGVAYPITESVGVHFAYGHFYQFPAIGTIFSNSDYSKLANLQASDPFQFGVFGNPDIDPERTVQYEFGYKQALSKVFGYEVSAYYKDIRDLVGIEFVETYTGARYVRLANSDFGDVIGITLALDHRALGPLSLALDYTWQEARGNSSDPLERANRAAGGEDPRPRVIPFDWDQRHTLNMTLALAKPEAYIVSAVLRAVTGQPYTPSFETAFGFGLDANSGRKPSSALLDLRAERSFRAGGLNGGVYARIFNVFDARYFNGFVFDTTGSPYYPRSVTSADYVQLQDPTRYYGPRRVELGLILGSR